ncbi:MAG: hypothetical protein KDI25_04515 [Pseudomonadales bacterium]|nr:hypothetical protein [Pseudomonadales bacterium]
MLELTPAYDICPQNRSGSEASQAMLLSGDNRMSKIASCLAAAAHFQLSEDEAAQIANRQCAVIKDHWEEVCDEAQLSVVDRRFFWHRQFLNPYALDS